MMSKIRLSLCFSAVLLTSLANTSGAQTADDYIPLFTPEQISKASEIQRKRMQSTEKLNRDTWINRRKDAAAEKAKQAAAASPPKPPPPKYTRKGKIYKWVDAQGRVHFGDAPTGKDSEQIKLRNTAPAEGAPPPPPAPHLKKAEEDT